MGGLITTGGSGANCCSITGSGSGFCTGIAALISVVSAKVTSSMGIIGVSFKRSGIEVGNTKTPSATTLECKTIEMGKPARKLIYLSGCFMLFRLGYEA